MTNRIHRGRPRDGSGHAAGSDGGQDDRQRHLASHRRQREPRGAGRSRRRCGGAARHRPGSRGCCTPWHHHVALAGDAGGAPRRTGGRARRPGPLGPGGAARQDRGRELVHALAPREEWRYPHVPGGVRRAAGGRFRGFVGGRG
ncbi:hypothetical protein QJS66_13875 [Kocuria rhizophila]|nr:hypothetical protein QJS66_13875 [Kocuria rhizophila]